MYMAAGDMVYVDAIDAGVLNERADRVDRDGVPRRGGDDSERGVSGSKNESDGTGGGVCKGAASMTANDEKKVLSRGVGGRGADHLYVGSDVIDVGVMKRLHGRFCIVETLRECGEVNCSWDSCMIPPAATPFIIALPGTTPITYRG
jgi:hypothetical protein